MTVERELGAMFARLEALEGASAKAEQRLDGVAEDVRAIRSTLDQAKGGWRVLVVAGGAIAAVSSAATGILVKWLSS